MVCTYLHVPPFEDQGEDRTKAETGNFIQSIQQLGEKREGEGKEGRSEEGRGGEKEERREGKERERRVGINHCTIHSTRCCTGSGSHGRLLSPGHSEGLPLFEETLTEDNPKRKGRRRGRRGEREGGREGEGGRGREERERGVMEAPPTSHMCSQSVDNEDLVIFAGILFFLRDFFSFEKK